MTDEFSTVHIPNSTKFVAIKNCFFPLKIFQTNFLTSFLPHSKQLYSGDTKVLITCHCSDKILGYNELVHEGVIMMFMNQFIVTQNSITALTGDKYFSKFSNFNV